MRGRHNTAGAALCAVTGPSRPILASPSPSPLLPGRHQHVPCHPACRVSALLLPSLPSQLPALTSLASRGRQGPPPSRRWGQEQGPRSVVWEREGTSCNAQAAGSGLFTGGPTLRGLWRVPEIGEQRPPLRSVKRQPGRTHINQTILRAGALQGKGEQMREQPQRLPLSL